MSTASHCRCSNRNVVKLAIRLGCYSGCSRLNVNHRSDFLNTSTNSKRENHGVTNQTRVDRLGKGKLQLNLFFEVTLP